MSTFVYSPGVKVYIDSYKLGQIVDVSSSLVGLGMVRRAEGVSTMNFALTNPLRKYDNVFTPNDRIVVVMKRLTWMRTFTGYLNSVPIFSSWPRDVQLTASCSLKRLQYFYWDPELPASSQLVLQSLRNQEDGSPPDGGIKQAAINLLEEVVDWSGSVAYGDKSLAGSKIHIGGIPRNWFDFARRILESVAANVENDAALAAGIFARLGGTATLGGPGVGGAGNVAPGAGGLNEEQRGNAKKILDAAFALGASPRDAEYCIGCVLQESNLYQYWNPRYPETKNVPGARKGTDHDSVGFYQQRPSQGWGTPAQCMEVNHSTRKFLEGLRGIRNRDSLPFTTAIQKVQRSAYPNAYAKHEPTAKAIVASYLGSVSTLGGDSYFPPLAGGTGVPQTTVTNPRQADRQDQQRQAGAAQQQGTTSSAQICTVAQQLVAKNVPYKFGSVTKPSDPNPRDHDCSSFVEWVYFQCLGVMNGIPSQSQAQYEWGRSRGREITVEQGIATPGALLFRGRGNLAIGHVEISLGGGRSIGTRKTGTNASEVSTRAGYWTKAVLMPSVNYPNSPPAIPATGDTALPGQTAAEPNSTAQFVSSQLAARQDIATQILSGADVGDSLFGSRVWENVQIPDHGFAEALTGIRALSNDTPILPYIGNLMNATLRSYCSAPNGDFMAWFPDYYGIWGTAAKMVLQPIEVRDFTVAFSDENLVTHQYVAQTIDGNQVLNLGSGEVQVDAANIMPRVASFGIATIDQPGIIGALFGIDQTPDEVLAFQEEVYKRYGPRSNYTQVPGVTGPDGEFFMALYLFMQNWTAAYNANIEITFMPELWPGMLIQFPEYNFQAYVNTVDHAISFGPSGGFRTTINIQAPSRIKDLGAADPLKWLPLAGANGDLAFGGSHATGKSSSSTGGVTPQQQEYREAARAGLSIDEYRRKKNSNPRLERL